MSAYLRMQLALVALSGALTFSCWAVSGLVPPARRSMLLRLALVGFLGIPASFFGGLVLSFVMQAHASGFAVIAVLFYAMGLWIPLALVRHWLVEGRRRPWRARVLARWAVLGALSTAIGLWAMFVAPNRLVVHEERFEFPRWRGEGPPLRVVHISDLQTIGEGARERRALARIRELAPDLIVFTGDLVAGPLPDGDAGLRAARSFFAGLDAPLGVFAVEGHSEPDEIERAVYAGLDVTFLYDEAHTIDVGDGRRLRLVGLSAWRPDLGLLATQGSAEELLVVASHFPDVSPRLPVHVDLHLAGHTHGGQIVVPFFGPPLTLSRLPRDTARGTTRRGPFPLHVSAGIGMEGGPAPRVRLFCPPEICLLELAPGGAGKE